LNDQIQQLYAAHQEEASHTSKCIAELEAELKREVDMTREMQTKLKNLEIKLKHDADKQHDVIQNLQEQLVDERTRHQTEVETLRNEHNAQLTEIETQGASVVSDLEESIASLEKEVKDNKFHHEQAISQLLQKISQAHTEKELLGRQIKEGEKTATSRDEQIIQLSNLSQHRGEEMVVLQKELTQLRSTMDKEKREHSNAIETMSREVNTTRLAHEQEIKHIQLVIDDLRTKLAAANARLDAGDEELNITKSKLNERTNLLKEMVVQTKSNKADYDQEHARANQLHELMERYKSELVDARANAKRFESEMNEKVKQLWDLLRKESDQRKAMEAQLESKIQNLDDVGKKFNDMEKENHMLKVYYYVATVIV
jgi:chromosome segregation ATPase